MNRSSLETVHLDVDNLEGFISLRNMDCIVPSKCTTLTRKHTRCKNNATVDGLCTLHRKKEEMTTQVDQEDCSSTSLCLELLECIYLTMLNNRMSGTEEVMTYLYDNLMSYRGFDVKEIVYLLLNIHQMVSTNFPVILTADTLGITIS